MNLDHDKIKTCWTETLDIMKALMSESNFESHIVPLKIEISENELTVISKNQLSQQIIKDNYLKILEEIINKKLGYNIKVNLTTEHVLTPNVKNEEKVPPKTVQKSSSIPKSLNKLSMDINPEYCFETFIVGNNNRLAAACAEAVTTKPGKVYNPLLIYGDSGLGKTHLMQAIGNRTKEINPGAQIFYSTGEYFTSLFVDAIREKKIQSFRKSIRNYDLFLLDDIQFLLNKEGTVSEFFHTFNALYESGKQIVLTSDRSPSELDMDNRLISRFEQGMFTDIKHPDFETRLAILKEKSKNENINLPEDVLEYVAKIITDNIRKLQGALTRLMAQSSIYNIDIDLSYAQTILTDYYKLNEKIVDINKIQQVTAEYFNISITDMLSTTRTKDITLARQIAMYLCRDLTELSLPTIGKAFGGRDHTTVIHSCNKIQEKLSQEPGFRQQINELSGKILH